MKLWSIRLSALLGIPALLFGLAPRAYSTSFDCQKAKSINEHLICDDLELSKLDDEFALAYKEALRKSATPKELITDQRDAWRRREKECPSKTCLVDWFAQRQAFLSATPSQVTSKLPAAYLPWTLDVAGFESGKCEITELARSFKEARNWASESSGWIKVHNIIESPEKILSPTMMASSRLSQSAPSTTI